MKRIGGVAGLALLVVAMLSCGRPAVAQESTATGPALVLLVRHAEEAQEPADDPGITAEGKTRAEALAAALRDAGVTAVITSPLLRTRETGEPLATALGLRPTVVPIISTVEAHIAAVAVAVRKRNGVVVVVGHSNTIPQIIAALGGPTLPEICEDVYDDLFGLVMVDGKTDLVRGRYGPANAKADPACK